MCLSNLCIHNRFIVLHECDCCTLLVIVAHYFAVETLCKCLRPRTAIVPSGAAKTLPLPRHRHLCLGAWIRAVDCLAQWIVVSSIAGRIFFGAALAPRFGKRARHYHPGTPSFVNVSWFLFEASQLDTNCIINFSGYTDMFAAHFNTGAIGT